MAIHLLPLLLAKVVGKFAAKGAVHHGHQHLGGKIAKQGAQQAAKMAAQKAAKGRGKKDDK
jgi:hypothetical protein